MRHDLFICDMFIISPGYDATFSRVLQPIAFGALFNLNLQSQSHWSLFNGAWQKRPRELVNID